MLTMVFSVVFYTVKIMFYVGCYLTETSMLMNYDTDTDDVNVFSHPMMINATLFIVNCICRIQLLTACPITLYLCCSIAF